MTKFATAITAAAVCAIVGIVIEVDLVVAFSMLTACGLTLLALIQFFATAE